MGLVHMAAGDVQLHPRPGAQVHPRPAHPKGHQVGGVHIQRDAVLIKTALDPGEIPDGDTVRFGNKLQPNGKLPQERGGIRLRLPRHIPLPICVQLPTLLLIRPNDFPTPHLQAAKGQCNAVAFRISQLFSIGFHQLLGIEILEISKLQ